MGITQAEPVPMNKHILMGITQAEPPYEQVDLHMEITQAEPPYEQADPQMGITQLPMIISLYPYLSFVKTEDCTHYKPILFPS